MNHSSVIKWLFALLCVYLILMVFLASQVMAADATPTPPVSHVACYPKVRFPPAVVYGSIPAGVSTINDTYAVWVCELPTGYVMNVSLFNLADIAANIVKYEMGQLSADQVTALCATQCTPFTDSEITYANGLIAANRPKALVAFNGAAATRAVYGANADGTLNPTPIAGESIAVATRCNEAARIPTAPTYYSVAGQIDQGGKALPENTFALCVVSLPNGSN